MQSGRMGGCDTFSKQKIGAKLRTERMEGAVETLRKVVDDAQSNLDYIQTEIKSEFESAYDGDAQSDINPSNLLDRLHSLQTQMPALVKECDELLVTKQYFLDFCKKALLENRRQISELRSQVGLQNPEAEDAITQDFLEMNMLWAEQVQERKQNYCI
eukprot:TRINITY_DN7991_c0_g2_i1.p1 TRINITY_DN7991_c0_g2~~TRINITY_DN7991_c0_g2_i1.p1  ORF type:complete len:158 (+),score=29.83 TRINITY_DN7991_c0_g2_i1:105-578(+)